MKLISMTEFVLMQNGRFANGEIDVKQLALLNLNYANFLKQLLELWMFVPCRLVDGAWVPYKGTDPISNTDLFMEFDKAKERVLFENGTEVAFNNFKYTGCETVEDTIDVYELELTPTAIKQIGL